MVGSLTYRGLPHCRRGPPARESAAYSETLCRGMGEHSRQVLVDPPPGLQAKTMVLCAEIAASVAWLSRDAGDGYRSSAGSERTVSRWLISMSTGTRLVAVAICSEVPVLRAQRGWVGTAGHLDPEAVAGCEAVGGRAHRNREHRLGTAQQTR